MKEYTQQMRINQEPCPYCGFWHSASSHPPQFAGYVFEIQTLEGKLKAADEVISMLHDDVFDLCNGEMGDYYKVHLEKAQAILVELRDRLASVSKA
jgi:hypothetical protein